MKYLVLILLLSVTSPFTYAHPNHMSFEGVQHDPVQVKPQLESSEQFNHIAIDEQYTHSNTTPCSDPQHRSVPCKRK